ncbi:MULTISPECIES: precorrin-6y C5,15-methyltransferase (decarboxylating) subunit CbiE [Methylobacterium]|uniref:precorrin-6y C5,15-methyltransferase (decarboxylating) subunit CbiE n=1 Tax=Methylobacterium TaxID=407 RepID=UPI0013ED5683|nr:precorrin-6y C5,15-methyltransferase (decarboxylating) subunit CbiE [Methylobacterium sp. DB0501]NGM35416.1 precorrin-6y C5,15-methyltransferase (decarboxylating) subunit CbiE [Methylobacterium sp. DB0501]
MTAFSPEAPPVSSVAPWLFVVGIGEDGRSGLSPAATAALDGAGLVVGGRRHLELAAPLAAETLAWPSPLTDAYPAILARRGQPTCVLATGDPFHYGVGAELARLVPASEIAAFPQASAFSLAAARLGWPLAEVGCLTLHGRALERVIPHLQPGARLLVLSWDGTTPGKLAALLAGRGFPRSRLVVLEAMGGPRERRRTGLAAEFAEDAIDPLNTIAVEVAAGPDAKVIPLSAGLDDGWFEHDGQLTKAEIRAVTLAALRPRAGQLLWDVGAGSGSIGIEWCLRHPANRAIAIEAREERAGRIRRNASYLGVPDLRVVVGRAPDSLAGLPAPDAAFLGGGVSDPALVAALLDALPSGGRLVANAVTLESEGLLLRLHAEHGGTLRRLSVARAEPVGHLTGWRPAMPVTQWALTKP